MKLAGFFLLVSGWIIELTAFAILKQPGARAAFVVAGVAVELAGLALVFMGHTATKEDRR